MKRLAVMLGIGFLALVFNVVGTQTAAARSEYKGRMEEATKKTKGADVIKEKKCNVCHGKDKKIRNDFGNAMLKHITKEDYMSLKSDKEKLHKKVDEAIQAALKEKSPEGKSFGELIDAGLLPGKALE